MKKILLTGATGFLGSHLLEALVSYGYDVVILKRSGSDTWRIDHLLSRVKYYDVDSVDINNVFSENAIDVIVHLATLYRKFDNGEEVSEMIEANVSFPVNLLEMAVRYGVKAFINTGTFFEYECSELPISEGAQLKPFNLYAKTKLAFEAMLSSYSDKLSINTFRLFSPYGEKDNDKLIPMIVKKALAKEMIELSDGMQKLDFIYSSDIVRAYLKSIEKIGAQTSGYQVYNLGSGSAVSIRDVVSILEQKLDRSLDKEWGLPSRSDMPFVLADISKIQRDFDWSPEVDIHKGIENMINYYKSEAR